MSQNYPLFVKRDIDGFFGLLIDNLVQLMLIPMLCAGLCGMSGEESRFIYVHMLPGAAVSILVGNLFYAWQAHRLAKKTGRSDVTALPYGINTPSLLVYVFFVMAPAYAREKSAEYAWLMGLLACLGSGVIELLGAFVAGWIRRHTPRAALLSTLAGIAIGFISMTFALQIFHKPLVAMLPLAIILIALFSRTRFPLGMPGGLVALALGAATAWLLPESWTGVSMSTENIQKAVASAGWYPPIFEGSAFVKIFNMAPAEWLPFVSVIIPMGLFNVIGSLQNIESAEAAGDSYDTFSSLAANGVSTIFAALFGSPFPTTIYIGHPGWKGLGARAGYSTLNGVVITAICVTGTVQLINSVIPIEAGYAIVLWVGIIITAQAFQSSPPEHSPAVALGLFPAIAAWGATVVLGAFTVAGGATVEKVLTTLQAPLIRGQATEVNGFLLHGMLVIERGYIFTCMILAAIAAFLIDRKFFSAGMWSLVAAVFTWLGLMHAYQVRGNELDFHFRMLASSENALVYTADPIAIGYLLFAAVFFAFGAYHKKHPSEVLAGH